MFRITFISLFISLTCLSKASPDSLSIGEVVSMSYSYDTTRYTFMRFIWPHQDYSVHWSFLPMQMHNEQELKVSVGSLKEQQILLSRLKAVYRNKKTNEIIIRTPFSGELFFVSPKTKPKLTVPPPIKITHQIDKSPLKAIGLLGLLASGALLYLITQRKKRKKTETKTVSDFNKYNTYLLNQLKDLGLNINSNDTAEEIRNKNKSINNEAHRILDLLDAIGRAYYSDKWPDSNLISQIDESSRY